MRIGRSFSGKYAGHSHGSRELLQIATLSTQETRLLSLARKIFISGEVLYGVKRTNKNQEWGLRCVVLREFSGVEIFLFLAPNPAFPCLEPRARLNSGKDSALPCRLGSTHFASWPI